jgi:ribose-phosphate pyrophosphokinase
MKILSGNSNRPLAQSIAGHLKVPLVSAPTHRYADGEIFVEIHESIHDQDIFVIQSTSSPANDHLMELLIIIDALKRGSARSITAVVPYYGYGRQDRLTSGQGSIAARLVANLITTAGANRVMTFDWHSAQIQGFFDIPTDHLTTAPLFCEHIQQHYGKDPITIVSPDVGGLVRARVVAEQLGQDMAIIDKRRIAPGKAEVKNLIGDIKDRSCIIIDDMVDSAGTLCNAAQVLKEAGAKDVAAYVSHGVLSGSALKTIGQSELSHLVISDTIQPSIATLQSPKIEVLSVASYLAQAIKRIGQGESITNLFEIEGGKDQVVKKNGSVT